VERERDRGLVWEKSRVRPVRIALRHKRVQPARRGDLRPDRVDRGSRGWTALLWGPPAGGFGCGARLPGFRDVMLGGNAVDSAGPGYDLVSGLGTPDVDNLVWNILVLQKATR